MWHSSVPQWKCWSMLKYKKLISLSYVCIYIYTLEVGCWLMLVVHYSRYIPKWWKKSLSLESSGMCSAWSSCLRGTNFQWISGALLQLCPRAIGTWILTKLLKHITEKHRKTGFWQFLTLTVSPNFFTVWGGYIWVQFFVFVQQFLWILLQERFLLNGFLHIPSCSAPHSMWSQTVTDGPVSFQYNLRPAIHHRGIDDHTKCRSSILK